MDEQKVRRKSLAWRRYVAYSSAVRYREYVKERNRVTSEIRKAKKEFEKKIVEETTTNPKAFYRYANSKLRVKPGVCKLKKPDGSLTKSDKETVDVLNSFFQAVFVKEEEEGDLPQFAKKQVPPLNKLTFNEGTIEEILKNLNPDEKDWVDINYLDCEKAFDRVPLRRLIAKLGSVGISGRVLGWIENFLRDCRQRVKIQDSESSWLPVYSGVLQGSVFGPVLFIVYMNDIVWNLESGISLFADDAKVYRRIATIDVESLQRDMDRLSEWSRKWLLSFNVAKCKTMHIGHSNPRNDSQLQGITLEKSDLEKDLGVFLSSDLKSSAHVAKIAAKANARVGLIKRTFTYMDREIFTSLYTTLVRPILDYGVQCWSPYLAKDINKLEQMQRRATLLVPECSTLCYEERYNLLDFADITGQKGKGQHD